MSKFNPQPKQGQKPKKTPKPIKKTAIRKKFKVTGEKDVFQVVMDEIPYDAPTKCFVCGKQISIVTHANFAHVLSKGKYPKMRLEPRNIKILCHNAIAIIDFNGDVQQGCHYTWDMEPRSKIINNPKWQPMLKLEAELKQEYKFLQNL